MTEKSRENVTENVEILDTYKQNMLRTVDEISKFQPQYAQSISNLQQDYLQVTKELINRMVSIQKQQNEITSQGFHAFDTANQLAIDILNSIRENIKLLGKTFETVTEYNANLSSTWSNFYTSAQKQYLK